MTNANRLVVLRGGPGSGKTAALIARYVAVPLEERPRVAFLAMSRPAARELEQRLHDAGADPAPMVWTLPQLPSEVLRVSGVAPARILSETDRQRLLAWLLEQESERKDAPERLSRWAACRRAVAPELSAATGLLQRCRVSPGEFTAFADAAANADVLAPIARMYAAYGRALSASGQADFDGLNEQALQALQGPHRPALADILFVDDAQELDALQARVVAALAGTTGHVVAAVDDVQRTQMYRGAVPDVAPALSGAMGVTAESVSCEGGASDSVLGAVAADFGFSALSGVGPAVRHIVARTPRDEARLVAELLRNAKGRRAVLTRSNGAAAAMRDALRREGVAVAAAWQEAAHAQRFLRDALTLLQPERDDDEDGRAARLRSALHLLAFSSASDDEVLEARKACSERSDGPLPERVAGWVDEAREMASLAEQIHRLCTRSQWLSRLPESDRDATARAYSGAITSLFDLEQTWRTAKGKSDPLPPSEALAELRGVLFTAVYPDAEPSPVFEDENAAGDAGQANLVDVLPVHHAAGRHWDHIVICELQDGGFPQYAVPSPFITADAADEMRAWLEGREGHAVALGRFERRAEVTVEEERRLYLTALSRAVETVTLACHVQEADHPVAPSWFFQRLLPDGMPLSPDAPSQWRCLLRDTLPERDGGLTACDACPVKWCSGRMGAVDSAPMLEQAVAPEPVKAPDPGAPALRPDWLLSPTALNTYFACPRKFFLANALRLSDEGTDSTAAGSALHAIMKRFNEAAPPRTRETLRQAMNGVFGDTQIADQFSSRAAWRLTQRKIRRALDLLWERTQDGDANALWVEKWLSFALEDDEGVSHRFGGKVDLAISQENGLAIVDYKSGRPSKDARELRRKMPVVNEQGEVQVPEDGDVQLPFYAAAAIAKGLNPISVAHEYITISRPGEGRQVALPIVSRPEVSPEGACVIVREDLEAFARFFANTARRIKETTRFVADPSSGECEAHNAPCPFASICDREGGNA